MSEKCSINSKDLKNQIFKLLDMPSFEPYQTIKEGPIVSELVSFLKKNSEFLPPELQYFYGFKPQPKQQYCFNHILGMKQLLIKRMLKN